MDMVTTVIIVLVLVVSLLLNIKQRFQVEELTEKVNALQTKYNAIREYAEYLSNRKNKKE